MAISTPVQIAYNATYSGAVTSLSSAVTTPVDAGSSIVVCMYVGGSPTATNVTDSKGNSYTTNVSASPQTRRLAIASAHNVNALSTSDTITITYGSTVASGALRDFLAHSFTGLTATAQLDKTTNILVTGPTWSADPGVLTQNNEIIWWSGLGGTNATAHTPNANCIETLDADYGTAPRITKGYKITSVGDGVVGGTYNTAPMQPGAVVATFREAAAVPMVPGMFFAA